MSDTNNNNDINKSQNAANSVANEINQSNQSSNNRGVQFLTQNDIPQRPQKIKDLKRLEMQLKQEVDADFFQDPKQFRALTRVIDVLGAQLLDANENGDNDIPNNVVTNYNLPSESNHKSHVDNLHKNNSAYSSLRKQQEIIEQAIEHLTVNHYSDLNASVVAVGHVSKRFGEAVGQVKSLRRQVQEIRENLVNASVGGAGGVGLMLDPMGGEHDPGNSETKVGEYYQHHQLGGKSLRELWLKKLECEAVLSLLQKLDVIRKTPSAFDALVHSQPCRIGAAVVLLSDAIDTIFKKDVTQIQALHKITEQLMSRKQKAEEILWETLQDVLYLRTGNGDSLISRDVVNGIEGTQKSMNNIDLVLEGSIKSGGADSGGKMARMGTSRKGGYGSHRNKHMFVATHRNGDYSDSDSDSENDTKSASTDDRSKRSGNDSSNRKNSNSQNRSASRKTMNPSVLSQVEEHQGGAFAHFHGHQGRLLPRVMVESELDVEVDEMRCLENWKNSNIASYSSYSSDATLILPRYTDPVLALRILIEAIAKLGRLDDVERVISENLERELRRIAQLEQANTLSKLEKYRIKAGSVMHRRNDASEERLKVFKSHLRALLKGFGSVMLRLSYLTQILRHRIVSFYLILFVS